MLGVVIGRRYRALVLLCGATAAIGTSIACTPNAAPARTRPVIRIGGGEPAPALAAEYRRSLPDVDVQLIPPRDPVGVIAAIERGDVDVGVAFADAAYLSQIEREANPTAGRRPVRAIASLHVSPLFLIVRSGAGISNVRGLAGHRVRLTSRTVNDPRFRTPLRTPFPHDGGGGTVSSLSELVLTSFGVSPRTLRDTILPMSDAEQRLANGTLDAAFATSFSSDQFAREMVARGVRLLPLEGPPIEALRREYPFIQRVRVRYAESAPPLHTIGVSQLLVCRGDLDDDLVYRLARGYMEAVERLAAAAPALRLVSLQDAPATPLALHEGAARYYRQWELFR